MARKKKPVVKDLAIQNEKSFKNGLSDAVFGFQAFDPTSIGVQLSQADTLFRNNRWYLVSNMRQLLSEIYVELGLVQTIVDVPVDDAMRGGVTFQSKQLSEEQISELKVSMDREDDFTKSAYAAKWNRLFGGGANLIMTGQDPSTPLDIDALDGTEELEFRDVDMWELFWSKQNTSDYSAAIDGADFTNIEFYDYYGVQVHNSRVLKLQGIRAPSFIRPRLRGWGVSVVETLVRSINQYLKATDLGFEVLDEFKLDIFKVKNLANTLLTPDGTRKVQQRIQLANLQKNYQNAITMDSEDDYLQKQLSFSGLADTMQGIRMQVASDMRMPLTKLFGISAQGFSSGEDDIENYNAMVEGQVRNKIKWHLLRMAELRCQQHFGFIPDDLELEFAPLRIMSSEQQESVKTQQFNRVQAAKQNGDITDKEYREAINKGNLLPVKLDMNVPEVDVDTAETDLPKESKSKLLPKDAPDARE